MRGATRLAVSQAFNLTAGTLASVVLARELGASGKGQLTTLQTIVAISVSLGLLGMPTLALRANLLSEPKVSVLSAVCLAIASSLVLVAGFSALVLVPTTGQSTIEPPISAVLAILMGAAIGLVATEFQAARFQARMEFRALAALRVLSIGVPLLVIATVAALNRDPVAAYFAGVVSSCIGLGVCIAVGPSSRARLLRTRMFAHRITDRGTWSRVILARTWRDPVVAAAYRSHLGLMLLMLVYRLDVLLLGALSGPAAVGVYSVGFMAAEVAWLMASGTSIAVAPKLVRASGEEIEEIRRNSIRRSLRFAAGVCILGGLFGWWAIPLVFGQEFEVSYVCFLILVPGILTFVPFKLWASEGVARGRSNDLTKVCSILVVVNVALNVLFAPTFGAIGTACAATSTYLLGYILVVVGGR